MIAPRYLTMLVLGLLIWVSAFVALSLFIDPYGVSPFRVAMVGVNQIKPKRVDIDRLLKPYEVWRYQPKTVFLGTSRIHQSLDPAVLDGTRFAPAYNASIPASSLGLNISHLQQYLELNPQLRTVVVELFLYYFLGQPQERPPKDFSEYLRNSLNLFISGDTLWASMQTLAYNFAGGRPQNEIAPRGHFLYQKGHNARGFFAGYAAGIWKSHATRPDGMRLHEPAFGAVRELIDLCRERRLELIFVLGPAHAYEEYYYEATGAWTVVREWLKRLSTEGATIWSFSQPNDWVYEPVSERMRYWYDPYHFTLEMGRGVLRTIAALPPGDLPPNFAMRLTPDVVDDHVDARRAAIREWAKANPGFVAAFHEEKRRFENPGAPARVLPGGSLDDLVTLQAQVAKQYPGGGIAEYRVVSDELVRAGVVPPKLLQHGRMVNPWGGPLVVQQFPAGAWGPGTPPTHNFVLEAVPRADCSRLLADLGKRSELQLLRINVEPSGKVHSRLPVRGSDGCDAAFNNIGYAVVAR